MVKTRITLLMHCSWTSHRPLYDCSKTSLSQHTGQKGKRTE